MMTTVAGKRDAAYNGDGGPAREAALSAPWGLALASSGELYISDNGNNVIRKVI